MLSKGARAQVAAAENTGPSLFTALEEQIGVKLISQKVRVEYLVILSVEQPAEN